ncbi:hypothetical protein L9F63_017192, partial [Diploptera punctata]
RRNPFNVSIPESLNENIPFKEISLRRRGRNSLPTSLPVTVHFMIFIRTYQLITFLQVTQILKNMMQTLEISFFFFFSNWLCSKEGVERSIFSKKLNLSVNNLILEIIFLRYCNTAEKSYHLSLSS